MESCLKILPKHVSHFRKTLLADAREHFRLTPASTVFIRYVSVHRRNSPYFVKSSPRCSSLAALIYPRLRASSRLYEKLRPESAFSPRREDEEGGGSEDGGGSKEAGVILLYQAGKHRFREFIFS